MDMQELRTSGKIFVQYPRNARNAVADAMAKWMAFCALPLEIKKRFEYTPDHVQSGNGYEFKDTPGSTLDRKENFHARLSARNEMLELARQVGAPEATALVESALAIPDLIMPMLINFARDIGVEYGLENFVRNVADSKPEIVIRLLHYFGDAHPLDEIASPHIDKGGFTLHLWESDSGVEQLSRDKTKWIPIPVSHDEAVIFPASGLQYLLNGEVKALCHRVRATHESARVGRYSAVAFVDFLGNAHYDKKTHGRLQDWPAGFNYDMPNQEFRRLFIRQ